MRKSLVALLLSMGVTAFAANLAAAAANVDESIGLQPKQMNAEMARELYSRAARLQTSANDVDTVYIGYTPGHGADNYWSIWSGSDKFHPDGQWHRPPARGGMWDWEGPYGDVKGDSLQGWTPYRHAMGGTGGLTIDDRNRPWRCLDYGNNASGVIPGSTRTYGVVGVWHVDAGNTQAVPSSVDYGGTGTGLLAPDPVLGVGGVNWAPLHDDGSVAGVGSAWMGLRRHGDNTHVDAVSRGGTGNPFNENVLLYQFDTAVSAGGTDKRFPGYGAQMDQMLYRDIDVTGVTNLTVSFSYRTAMSTTFTTNALTRSGWFQHDPLTVIEGGGNPNFFASSGNPTPPADSFMVYVGSPAESSVVLSDGNPHLIFDKKRRWFGEVLRGNEGLYKQLLSVAGTNAATAFSTTVNINAYKSAVAAGVTNKVRLVFRVKTNQAFDDETVVSAGYGSGGVGAAIVDNVVINKDGGAAITLGHFDNVNQIDNRTDYGPYGNVAHATHPLNVWKSTGKPPAVYSHVHPIDGRAGGYAPLLYQDLCGQPGNPARICDLDNVVISSGDHDNSEASSPASSFATGNQEPFDGIWSPTVNLTGQGYANRTINSIVTPVNNMGLSAADADATDDYYLDYELYAGRFDFFVTGNAWRAGVLCYPAGNTLTGAGQYKRWSSNRMYPFIYFNTDKQCFRVFDGIGVNGMLRTTNASGVPDSMKIHLQYRQEAYRFSIPTSEWFDGAYWDNVSLAIVDGAGADPVGVDIWQWIHDSFPFNSNAGIVGIPSAFDTTSAHIRSGINISPTTGNTNRFDVPGDTTVVTAGGDATRIDMVFRILPGPGNYTNPSAAPGSQILKKLPTAATAVAGAVANSTNFWENYMFDRGAKGAGTHPSPRWSPHVWNAARMDTAQGNVFQLHKRAIITPGDPGLFMTAYHETELQNAHRRKLAVPRNICFVADTSLTITTQTIICGSGNTPPGLVYPPVWAFPAASTGLPTAGTGNPLDDVANLQIASCPGPAGSGLCQTIEGTKIIPDGLLTPGAHVQYFIRREDGVDPAFFTSPDTNVVTPQNSEGSTDGHRWQEFSVLPDRWKSTSYIHPVLGTLGSGEACVLYIDQNDRRGDERTFIGIADSLGMNAANKRGGSNGWSAAGDADPNDPTYFVRRHVGQAGTTFDKYDVKASESLNTGTGSIGSRESFRDGANTQIDAKSSTQGPTQAMLNGYYRVLLTTTGDLNSSIYGPFANKSQNDILVMQQFLQSGNSASPNRGFYAVGDGFVEHASGPGVNFMLNILGVDLISPNYLFVAANTAFSADINPTSALPTANGNIYGLRNACTFTLDVLDRSATLLSETAEASFYEDPNALGPFPSGIIKTHSATNPWISLVDGWDISNFRAKDEISSRGRLHYYYRALQDAFGAIAGCNVVGAPLTTVDTPGNNDGRLYNFMSLRNNPLRSGSATFAIGLAKSDRVKVQIFDVSGRLVRNIADRAFAAGEHTLTWDGVDNAGKQVARGVYFVRTQYEGQKFNGKSKLVVLK
jgi:hypothetical protein